jgi:hypothetical protein
MSYGVREYSGIRRLETPVSKITYLTNLLEAGVLTKLLDLPEALLLLFLIASKRTFAPAFVLGAS